MHWVGVDVAKDSMEVFVGPSRRFAVENTSEGLAQLVKELSAIEGAHVIFEATGGCEFMLSDTLAQAKIKFSRVNPRQRATSRRPSIVWQKRTESMPNFSRSSASGWSRYRRYCPTTQAACSTTWSAEGASSSTCEAWSRCD
jgi:hypothetical protein